MIKDSSYLSQALESKLKDSTSLTIKRGIQAGAYISLGSIFFATITSLNSEASTLKLIGAASFSIGLILVIFKKAQLFTGNNLMFLVLFFKNSSPAKILKNWSLVYLGNLLGSLLMASIFILICFQFPTLKNHLIAIALKKVNYTYDLAFSKAILCNILVCTAVVFGVCLKSSMMKILGIVIPITIFVFLGFEHSIANMFFIPTGLFLNSSNIVEGVNLFLQNIIPVTLGNILGGFIIALIFKNLPLKRLLHLFSVK